jgi:ketosteroid isomerase-like protein
MSAAEIEALRGLDAAFNGGGDWESFYHPDAELRMPAEWPDDPVYHGKEGLRKAVRQWREGFDEYHWKEERLIDAPDCVVGLYHHRGRIKHTGTWVDQAIGCVWRFRGDKIICLDGFFSWEEAIEAAGVSEADAAGAGDTGE